MTMVVPQVDVESNSNTIRSVVAGHFQSFWNSGFCNVSNISSDFVLQYFSCCFRKSGSISNLNGTDSKDKDCKLPPGPSTTQTWPFVEVRLKNFCCQKGFTNAQWEIVLVVGGHKNEYCSNYFTICKNLILSISLSKLHGFQFCKI